jgi:hypothetical protein
VPAMTERASILDMNLVHGDFFILLLFRPDIRELTIAGINFCCVGELFIQSPNGIGDIFF